MYKLVAPPPRVSVLPSPLPEISQNQTLSLLPLSDLHIPANSAATKLLIESREYLDRMDYMVLLGDLCACYGTDHEYRAVSEFIRQLEQPYSAINGNHEFVFEVHDPASGRYGQVWKEQSVNKRSEQLRKFLHFFDFPSLWRSEENALGKFIFLGLDDVAAKKVESLSRLQQEFLRDQLEAAQDRPVYVFCHAPLMIKQRLDIEYYDAERTACVEANGKIATLLKNRRAPLLWMSGHIHLRPDHHLFDAYQLAENIWQVHCPDSWGYSRWLREHVIPQHHEELYSRHLEIRREGVTLITHDHNRREDIRRQEIPFSS